MEYFLHGFGVFLGVLAGTAVTLLVAYINKRNNLKQQNKNLKFEFDYNIKKLDSWIEEIEKYRNAVNGDVLHLYFSNFDLGRTVTVTSNYLLQSGLLYNIFNHDDLGKILVIFSELTASTEQYINKEIDGNRRIFEECINNPETNQWTKYKAKVVGDVDFWDKKFKDHKKNLTRIRNSLK